ncbi:MAG: hypothetical protein K8S16_18680 [Bacteroidales bacterium]|nr:hypothetical protein [Bacteroidales bacterium]
MRKSFLYRMLTRATAVVICSCMLYACKHEQPDHDIVAILPVALEIRTGEETFSQSGDVSEIPGNFKADYNLRSEEYSIVIPRQVSFASELTPGISDSIVFQDVMLIVPEDGIHEPETFSITCLLYEDMPPVPNEICNVTGNYYKGYRFQPHGMIFDEPATIVMAYDPGLVPEGYTAEDIYTWYFDEANKKWKALDRDSINYALCQVVSSTMHFTDMINGIIKVPESPETEGFVPTSMQGIEFADPSSEITIINPPVASFDGDAKLAYQMKLPEGRMGMAPVLSLQYNSDFRSGWAGFGWGICTDGISVDNSWGVPRYLPEKESETYLYEGSQLTPVAHRGEYIDRSNEKRFYSRIEGSFSRIIRHGDRPDEYWWEVTSRDGIRNFYGGLPETGIITGAVSMDENENIGYWALVETRDLHGNFVSYKYEKPAECGQKLYVSEISYTAYEDEVGPYRILFLREDESSTYIRKDIEINARFGFIQNDRDLLRRIDISFNNIPVRSYLFQYSEGVFSRTLLTSISEFDASGSEFYTHHFEYYNDIETENGIVPYSQEKKWDIADDTLKSPYLNIFLTDISALGGSGSFGGSGGVAATVGLLDGRMSYKSFTAGGNISYQSTKNEGFLTLVDLNGDGLHDKV